MKPERRTEVPTGKERLTPREGINDELSYEILVDREKFVKNGLERVKSENPILFTWVLHAVTVSNYRDFLLENLLKYYLMFARSADEVGVPMLIVTEERIKEFVNNRSKALKLSKISDDQKIGLLEIEEIEMEKIVDEDMEKSDELGRYWADIARYSASQVLNGFDFFLAKYQLNEFARFMHHQEEANKSSRLP